MEIAGCPCLQFSLFTVPYCIQYLVRLFNFHSHACDEDNKKRHDVKQLASRRDHFTLDWLSSLTIILDEAPQRPPTGSGPSKAKSQF